jgi:putative FmdB family regulatory protein
MPIYEYECLDCGKRFEIFQKISEGSLTVCKECKGRLNRLISMCSFQLKGSGWYVTDYKSSSGGSGGNGSKQEKKEEGSGAKAESKTEAKTEAKTETKTEVAPKEASGGGA